MNPMINGGRQPSRGGTSRMNREVHVRFCEGLGVKFPGPTRPTLPTCALQQVVGYLRYTGRDANMLSQRVGRYWLALRRAQIFEALGGLLQFGIEAADAKPAQSRVQH